MMLSRTSLHSPLLSRSSFSPVLFRTVATSSSLPAPLPSHAVAKDVSNTFNPARSFPQKNAAQASSPTPFFRSDDKKSDSETSHSDKKESTAKDSHTDQSNSDAETKKEEDESQNTSRKGPPPRILAEYTIREADHEERSKEEFRTSHPEYERFLSKLSSKEMAEAENPIAILRRLREVIKLGLFDGDDDNELQQHVAELINGLYEDAASLISEKTISNLRAATKKLVEQLRQSKSIRTSSNRHDTLVASLKNARYPSDFIHILESRFSEIALGPAFFSALDALEEAKLEKKDRQETEELEEKMRLLIRKRLFGNSLVMLEDLIANLHKQSSRQEKQAMG